MSKSKTDNKFRDGWLSWVVTQAADIDAVVNWLKDKWQDGFFAFSKGEKRYNEFFGRDLKKLVEEEIKDIYGLDGYLMEAGLWRGNGGWLHEEISIERDDNGFYCQRWTLNMDSGTKSENNNCLACYWRMADVHPIERGKGRQLFNEGEMGAIEVIVPDRRLHFFLTTEGEKQ